MENQGVRDLRLVQPPKLLEFIASWGEVSPYTKSNQVLMLRSLWSYGHGENVGYFLRNIASTINYDNFSDLPKAERYLEDWEMAQLADVAQRLGEQRDFVRSDFLCQLPGLIVNKQRSKFHVFGFSK